MSSSGHERDDEASHVYTDVAESNETHNFVPGQDETSSDEERDGRFYGPESSWRTFTQAERAIASSLNRADNDNLSIHLYNTHKWKERLRRPDLDQIRPWHSKQRWVSIDNDGKAPFQPDDAWTAWPLRPADVPRAGETWGIPIADEDEDTFRKKVSWKPSLELEEALKADVLRQAKERFRARQTEWNASLKEEAGEDASADTTGSDFDPESSDVSDQSGDEMPDADQEEVSAEDAQDLDASEDLRGPLSFIADDEAASHLLQPTVRHIISKLEDVLVGLHRSRNGHRTEESVSRSRNSKSRSKSRSRQASPVVEEAEKDSSSDYEDGSRPLRKSAKRRKLGTRDWSEVLGVATLVGWDQGVIDRAARRCAVIFGESMDVRFMPDLGVDPTQEKVVHYRPDMIPPLDELEQALDPPVFETGAKQSDFSCPIKTCERHKLAYEKRWRLREHLQRKHGASGEALTLLMEQATVGENQAEVEIQTQFTCPYVDCDRHERPYEKNWRLREHMKRKHKVEAIDAGEIRRGAGCTQSGPLLLQTVHLPIGRSKDKQRKGSPRKNVREMM